MRVEQNDYYLGGAWVTDAQGSGQVTIIVAAAANHVGTPYCPPVREADEVSCDGGYGPAHEEWTLELYNDANNGRPNVLMYMFLALRPDGTFIQMTVENTATIKSETSRVSRPTPPMTEDQMLAVAFDPAIRA